MNTPKNDKLFHLETSYSKPKYTDINYIKTICENSTAPVKMEISLVYTKEDMSKDTKNYEL